MGICNISPPRRKLIFNAFNYAPFDKIKVSNQSEPYSMIQDKHTDLFLRKHEVLSFSLFLAIFKGNKNDIVPFKIAPTTTCKQSDTHRAEMVCAI